MQDNLKWVQSLRGLCAILVFVSHSGLVISDTYSFMLGRIGVVGFFLITGFLTPKTREKRNVLQYCINRFMRIYPVYWLILIIFYLCSKEIGIRRFILNLTLFNDFFGEKCIIGSSWMLPIQVLFFILIALLGIKIIDIEKKCVLNVAVCICGILAVATGIARYFLEKPYPTAIFLLIGVAFIGMKINISQNKMLPVNILIFNAFLLPATWLSYQNEWISYILAYNIGIVLFVLFKKADISIGILSLIGNVGFSFFLVPAVINIWLIWLERSVSISQLISNMICFAVSYLLAVIITYCIEKPILKLGYNIESKLSRRSGGLHK